MKEENECGMLMLEIEPSSRGVCSEVVWVEGHKRYMLPYRVPPAYGRTASIV